jgi:hypothetical protein
MQVASDFGRAAQMQATRSIPANRPGISIDNFWPSMAPSFCR